MPEIQRRKTVIRRPVVVQSMTNTDTADIESTVQQIAALARAGSELVRVTVNNDDAAKAVPYIVEGIAPRAGTPPSSATSTTTATCCSASIPTAPRPRQVPHQSRQRLHRPQGRRQLPHHGRVAVEHQKPVRIGVNWGSLDQALLTRMMDDNSKARRAARRPRRHDGSHGRLRARQRRRRRALRPAPRPDHPQRQGLRRPRPHRRLHRARRPLRLRAAPRPHRSRHGHEGRRRLHRRPRAAAARRHRRHHPRLAHPHPRRRPQRRSPLRPADPAVARHPQLHAAGHQLPRLRPHHLHLLPGARRAHPELPRRIHARVEEAVPRRRRAQARRHGLHRQRPRRIQARQHRHLAPRHLRRAQGPGLRRRQALHHPQGRPHRRRVPGHPRRVRPEALRESPGLCATT
jgi:hypothetical protein